MTWTKLSDDFSDDCWTLSDAAFRLHAEGLVWSNRKLLDCRIPKGDVRRFAKTPDALPELLAVGWWSEEGDTYLLRHHASYQRARADVIKQQEANRANGLKGGRPTRKGSKGTGVPREQWTSGTDSVSDSLSGTESKRDGTGRDGSAPTREREQGEREAEFFNPQPLSTPLPSSSSSLPPERSAPGGQTDRTDRRPVDDDDPDSPFLPSRRSA